MCHIDWALRIAATVMELSPDLVEVDRIAMRDVRLTPLDHHDSVRSHSGAARQYQNEPVGAKMNTMLLISRTKAGTWSICKKPSAPQNPLNVVGTEVSFIGRDRTCEGPERVEEK